MRVLIFEGGYFGHRLSYVAAVAKAVRSLSVETVVALPRHAIATEEYRAFIDPLDPAITVDSWIPDYRWKAAGAALERCFYLRKAVARVRADYVLIPHGDGMVQAAAVLPPLQWGLSRVPMEVLVMRGSFLDPRSSLLGRAKSLASRMTLARGRWDSIHLIDFRLWNALKRIRPQVADRFHLMPDPVPVPEPWTKEAARRDLGVPTEGTYLTIAGAIDQRKGVQELLSAMREAPDLDVTLLLAGKQAPQVREWVAQARARSNLPGRIVSCDRFLTDRELDAAIAASDVVATVYPGHVGPASILMRALAAGRPVLGSSDGWIGEVIRTFSVGWEGPPSDPLALAGALRRALREHSCFAINDEAKRLVAFNSPTNFRAAWTRGIRSRLGLPEEHVQDRYSLDEAARGTSATGRCAPW